MGLFIKLSLSNFVQFFKLEISSKSVILLFVKIIFSKLGILSPNGALLIILLILDILLFDKIKVFVFFNIEKFSNFVISL